MTPRNRPKRGRSPERGGSGLMSSQKGIIMEKHRKTENSTILWESAPSLLEAPFSERFIAFCLRRSLPSNGIGRYSWMFCRGREAASLVHIRLNALGCVVEREAL